MPGLRETTPGREVPYSSSTKNASPRAADRVIATSTPAPPPAYERAVEHVAQAQQTAEERLSASRAFHNPEYERMDRIRNGRVIRPLPLDRAYYIRNPLPDEAWIYEAGEDIGTLFGRLETAVERRRNARLEDGALVRPIAMSTIRLPSWSTLGNQRPLEDKEPSPGRAKRRRMQAWIQEHRRNGDRH